MKNIVVFSDSHLDVNSNQMGRNLLSELISVIKDKKTDLIIISGDLTNFADNTLKIIDVIQYQIGTKVLFIPGNHDVWVDQNQSSWDGYNIIKSHDSSLIDKPYVINNEYAVIGDMGWYDYSFSPETIPHSILRSRKKKLWNDSVYARWNMNDIDLQRIMIDKFEKQLSTFKDKKIIFVNHFIPYKEFITFKANDANWNLCNAFMGSSDLGGLLDQYSNIEWVLFGHTHKRYGVIRDFHGKNIICNPLGYKGEWESDDFISELEKTISLIQIP
ncbi:metallophosphoesterase [Bacillus sp. JJ634]